MPPTGLLDPVGDPPADDDRNREPSGPDGDPLAADRPSSPARRLLTRLGAAPLRIQLLPPLAVGLVVRILIGLTDDVPAVDATAYAESGRNLWSGAGFTYHGRPELHFPPLYPAVVGGMEKLLGSEQTALVVTTIFSGMILTVLLALLARRLSGSTAVAVSTAWLVGLCPGLTQLLVKSDAGTAAPYTAFLVGAALCVLGQRRASGRRELAWLLGAGACIGLGYLTRPEALIGAVFVLMAVALAALGGWRAVMSRNFGRAQFGRAVLLCLVTLVPIGVAVVPYSAWLHSHTEQWQLSAKTRDASLDAWRDVATGDRRGRDEILYHLDETGLAFDVETKPLTSLALEDPKGYLGIFGVNLAQIFGNYSAMSFPLPAWRLLPVPILLVGLAQIFRKRRTDGVGLSFAIGMVPVVTCLLFFTLPRYLTPATAILCVMAGWGLTDLRRSRRWNKPWSWTWPVALLLSLTSVIAGFRGPTSWWDPAESVEHRIAAEWLQENAGPDDVVMTRAFLLQHYLERDVLAVPYASFGEIMDFARHYGARWFVVDQQSFDVYRPELVPYLLGEWSNPYGLELAHEFEYQDRLTRIYRIVPPPPPSEDPVIPLGWIGDS